MTFRAVDPKRFPCFALARDALEAGGIAPAVLNAANEVAVDAFLQDRIGFNGISAIVEATLSKSWMVIWRQLMVCLPSTCKLGSRHMNL